MSVSVLGQKERKSCEEIFISIKKRCGQRVFSLEDQSLPPQDPSKLKLWPTDIHTSKNHSAPSRSARSFNEIHPVHITPKNPENDKIANCSTEDKAIESDSPFLKVGCLVHEDDDLLFEDPLDPSEISDKDKFKRQRTCSDAVDDRPRPERSPQRNMSRFTKKYLTSSVQCNAFVSIKYLNNTPNTNPIPAKSFYNTKRDDPQQQAMQLDSHEPHIRSRSCSAIPKNYHASPILCLPHEIGFKNMGNTCFVNATLQALLALPYFANDLKKASKGIPELPQLIDLFVKIISARERGLVGQVNHFIEKYIEVLWTLHPSYACGDQQDANEYLVRFLEAIKIELPSGPKNPIEAHFQCEIAEILHCKKCGLKTEHIQEYTSFCLPISENCFSLEQCLEAYTAEEERSIQCADCKAPSMIFSSKFHTLPRKLIMSINRYSKEGKISRSLVPPKELDISRFLEVPGRYQETRYALAALIIHIGESRNSGHYISQVLCDDGSWRSYSDIDVSVISFEGEVQTCDGEPAYVYFYVQKDLARKKRY